MSTHVSSLFQLVLVWFAAQTVLVAAEETGPVVVADHQSESRADELRNLRLVKARAPTPDKKDSIERLLLKVERGNKDRTLTIRYKDLYPKFGGPRSGSGFGGGLRYYKSNIRDSAFSFEGAGIFSVNRYRLMDVRFGSYNKTDPVFFSGRSDFGVPFDFAKERPGVKQTKTVFFGDVIYRHFPQERFWGLGPNAPADARTNYLQEDISFSVIGGYEFTNWFAAAAGVGLYKVDISEGMDERFPTTQEVFDDSSAPGLTRQPDFYRLLSAVYFNHQDTPGNPHKGGIVGIFFSRYTERRGDEFKFNRLDLDARHYIPLGSRQRTLAVQIYASTSFVGEGARIPFYLNPTLGGGKLLRGFHDFRFRDTNLVYLSTEYRWEPAPAFELALFYDLGTVFPDGYRFIRQDLTGTFGGGLRFKTANRVVLRFDVGKSAEGTRIQFSFGPSF